MHGKPKEKNCLTNATGAAGGSVISCITRMSWNVWTAPRGKNRPATVPGAEPACLLLIFSAVSAAHGSAMRGGRQVSYKEAFRLASMEHYGFGTEAMKKIKKCDHCGMMAPAWEQFCRECGTRLPDDTLYQFYKSRHTCCPVCEAVLPNEARYCPICGAKIK